MDTHPFWIACWLLITRLPTLAAIAGACCTILSGGGGWFWLLVLAWFLCPDTAINYRDGVRDQGGTLPPGQARPGRGDPTPLPGRWRVV